MAGPRLSRIYARFNALNRIFSHNPWLLSTTDSEIESEYMLTKKSCGTILALLAIAATGMSGHAAMAGTGAAQSTDIAAHGQERADGHDGNRYTTAWKHGAGLIISTDGEAVPIDALKRAIKGDFVWFRDARHAYVMVDPTDLARVEKIWTPYDIADAALSSSRSDLRKHEKILSHLKAEESRQAAAKADQTALMDDLAARIEHQKKLLDEKIDATTRLEQRRSDANEKARIALQQLLDAAVKSGKASLFPLAQEH